MIEDAVEGDIHDHVWSLLPWFVNGRLRTEDAMAVERHLIECALCREECAAQARIHDAICDDGSMAFAPEASYRKLAERLESAEATESRARSGPRWVKWLVAAVIVESAALVTWGAWALHGSRAMPPAPYVTLSNATESSAAPGNSWVHVVFTSQSTLADVQRLLQSVGARIVDGPTQSGVYTIALAEADRSDEDRVSALRASTFVRFAEPVYTGTSQSP